MRSRKIQIYAGVIIAFLPIVCGLSEIIRKNSDTPVLNEPVYEKGFKPIDTNLENINVKKRGIVINERISIANDKSGLADDSAPSPSSLVSDRISKDLRDFSPSHSQHNTKFINRCDNCNAFPWIPIARAIRLPPVLHINNEPSAYQPIRPQPHFYESKTTPKEGDNTPAASSPETNPPQTANSPIPHPIRLPFRLSNNPPSNADHNQNQSPFNSQHNPMTGPHSGSNYRNEPVNQMSPLIKPEKPAGGMFQSILNFFNPRKNAPKLRPALQNSPLPPIQQVGKKPNTIFMEPIPTAPSNLQPLFLEYEKPPPLQTNVPNIPFSEFNSGPPIINLPPIPHQDKIFKYNDASNQNTDANQELPVINLKNPYRKPEEIMIRPVQYFANVRYSPMAELPPHFLGHLVQPCTRCNTNFNSPGTNRFNNDQKYIPHIIPSAIRLPLNSDNTETIKSIPIAQYLASVEYPQEHIQAPLIDIPITKSTNTSFNDSQNFAFPYRNQLSDNNGYFNSKDNQDRLTLPLPITPAPNDKNIGDLESPTDLNLVSLPGEFHDSSSTYLPDLSPSAGNLITNFTGSPFKPTTESYANFDGIRSHTQTEFDWTATQISTFPDNEESTTADLPSAYQVKQEASNQVTPSQIFNLSSSSDQENKSAERPSDPAYSLLNPPSPSEDWLQSYWTSPISVPSAFASNGFQTTVTPPSPKKKKQIQIIVPYTLMSQQDQTIERASGSTESLISAINQLPEINQPIPMSEKPLVTLDALQQFLDNIKEKENGVDLYRLQKNIDTWTVQGYSNHKHSQSENRKQEDHVAQINPAKKIPEDFLTGNNFYSRQYFTTWNENEKQKVYSERISDGIQQRTDEAVETTSKANPPTEKTDSSKIWESIPVTVSPLTKEKVYMVTAIPVKEDVTYN